MQTSLKRTQREAIKAFADVVTEELKKGAKVQLVGFGTFEDSERAAREGRNPQTGKTMKIAACKAWKFGRTGKALERCYKRSNRRLSKRKINKKQGTCPCFSFNIGSAFPADSGRKYTADICGKRKTDIGIRRNRRKEES